VEVCSKTGVLGTAGCTSTLGVGRCRQPGKAEHSETSTMENILRNGVDLQGMYQGGKSFVGDAHYFEDVTTPAKVREYLDSFKVDVNSIINARRYINSLILHY
jgi:hypothetical protein